MALQSSSSILFSKLMEFSLLLHPPSIFWFQTWLKSGTQHIVPSTRGTLARRLLICVVFGFHLQTAWAEMQRECYDCVWKHTIPAEEEFCRPQNFRPDRVKVVTCAQGCITTAMFETDGPIIVSQLRSSNYVDLPLVKEEGDERPAVSSYKNGITSNVVKGIVNSTTTHGDSTANVGRIVAHRLMSSEEEKPPMSFFMRGCPTSDNTQKGTGCEEKSYKNVVREECYCTSNLCNGQVPRTRKQGFLMLSAFIWISLSFIAPSTGFH